MIRLASRARAAALTLAVATCLSAAGPVSLQDRFAGLSPAQMAFINNPANLKPFGLTKEKLATVLKGRESAVIKSTIASMMETAEGAKFQAGDAAQTGIPQPLEPTGDMAAVPLNTQAGNYNARTVLRPAILDKTQRDPGPFSVQRYLYEEDGIPTFAGAPVALRKEDLVAGDVDVAFVGIPINLGSGWRDSQNAPRQMRAMYGLTGYDIYAGIDPSLELNLADYGNLSTDRLSIELTVGHVRDMIGDMASSGVIPFIIGGDHSMMFPSVAAMVDTYGKGNVGVVHLDAHYNGARDEAHLFSDIQSVSRLIEEGLVAGENLVQVGLRGPEIDDDALQWMRSQNIQYHTMAQVQDDGWNSVMRAALKEAKNGPDNVFISFDMSVLDPAYGLGAGRPVPGGLTMREVIPIVRRLCAETNVVGFELLDVAPFLDLSYATTMNANYILHSCLTGVAMRKKGLTKTNYLSPMTVSD